jgi:hypothetical protein
VCPVVVVVVVVVVCNVYIVDTHTMHISSSL